MVVCGVGRYEAREGMGECGVGRVCVVDRLGGWMDGWVNSVYGLM